MTTERAINQISPTGRTATHDAPWSFLFEIKRHLFKYQISLPACFYYCSTELRFLTVAGMLSRDALQMDIGAKYFDGKLPFATHHIRQFEKVYGMRTIITIVKADYCLMSRLLLNILSNVTLPP